MANPKDRYMVEYPGGDGRRFQTLASARKERDGFERTHAKEGLIALIYDTIGKDYVE